MRQLLSLLFLFFVHLTSGIGQTPVQPGDGVVCRNETVAGFETITQKSYDFIGHTTTSDISHIKLYITQHLGAWYVGSNFITPGAPNPTKVVYNTAFDLDNILINIITDEESSISSVTARLPTVQETAQIWIDDEFAKSKFFMRSAFSNYKQIKLVCPEGVKNLTYSTVTHSLLLQCLPFLFAQFRNCASCNSLALLGQIPFKRNQIQVFNTYNNPRTAEYITEHLSQNCQNEFGGKAPLLQAVQQSDKPVVGIICHIDPSNSTIVLDDQSTLSYREIDALSVSLKKKILILGCRSAQLKEDIEGSLDPLNSLTLVQYLDAALQGSASFRDFFSYLSDDMYRFVISDALAHQLRQSTQLYNIHRKSFFARLLSRGQQPPDSAEPEGQILFAR